MKPGLGTMIKEHSWLFGRHWGGDFPFLNIKKGDSPMSYYFRFISVVIFSLCIALSVINCNKNNGIKGEKIELPVNNQWVPITSTRELWQIQVIKGRGDVLYFTCNKRMLNAEEQKKTRSIAEGKVGDMLAFGRTTTYFKYDELNRRTARTESITFFIIRVLELNKAGTVVTILVLPENIQNK